MFIYRKSLGEFIDDCNDTQKLAEYLDASINRKTGLRKKEFNSWKELDKLADAINNPNFKDECLVVLEHGITFMSGTRRIDAMVIYKSAQQEIQINLVELKGWSEVFFGQGIKGYGISSNAGYPIKQHPSEQVYEYEENIKKFLIQVNKQCEVKSFVFLPNMTIEEKDFNPLKQFAIYLGKEFDNLYFRNTMKNFENQIFKELGSSIKREEIDFLSNIRWKVLIPDISVQTQQEFMSKTYLSFAQEQTVSFIHENILNKSKKLIIVNGGPGSGKSLIALHLLKELESNNPDKKVSLFIPGKELRERLEFLNMAADRVLKSPVSSNFSCNIAIIDETHKAKVQIDAKATLGLLMKSSSIETIIAFHDEFQIVDKKSISKDKLIELAKTNNFEVVIQELSEVFRNDMDSSYVYWLRNWLYKEDNLQVNYINNGFKFIVMENEIDFINLYKEYYDIFNCRISAMYVFEWEKDLLDEKGMPYKNISIGGSRFAWNAESNYLQYRKSKKLNCSKELIELCKTNFLTHKKGWDYLGYYNSVQGAEFEIMFVYISDIFYLDPNNELGVDLSKLVKGASEQLWSNNDSSRSHENSLMLKNQLFVLLTRATKRCIVYSKDKKLRDYLMSLVKEGS